MLLSARIRRASDGLVLSTAEGFCGSDERTWSKRPKYALRAMAQTRAISRACRSAFAHIVVMMGAGLETTPAEEIPHDEPVKAAPRPDNYDVCPIGTAAGKRWEDIDLPTLEKAKAYYTAKDENYLAKIDAAVAGRTITADDLKEIDEVVQ